MRLNVRHFAILALILVASIGFGFAFDAVATAVEKKNHPRPDELAAQISESAHTYGVPEAVLWATVKNASNFASNAKSPDGSIGLMQLTPSQFDTIRQEILGLPPLDAGMLYDPDTNLQCGAAYLSHLYRLYGVWETVFAAYVAGEDTVNQWLKNPAYVSDLGTLAVIPDADVKDFVRNMTRAVSVYTKLYY